VLRTNEIVCVLRNIRFFRFSSRLSNELDASRKRTLGVDDVLSHPVAIDAERNVSSCISGVDCVHHQLVHFHTFLEL
jgi:hypothetical protein